MNIGFGGGIDCNVWCYDCFGCDWIDGDDGVVMFYDFIGCVEGFEWCVYIDCYGVFLLFVWVFGDCC